MAEDCGLNAVALHAPHPRAGLLRRRPLGVDRRRQGRRAHPRHRQRRHPHPRGRRRHGRRHPLHDAVMIGRAAPAKPLDPSARSLSTPPRAENGSAGTYDRPTDADRYNMIRDYFGRLIAELAEHPTIPVTDDSDTAKRLRRDHEGAQRETLGKMEAVCQLVHPRRSRRCRAATRDLRSQTAAPRSWTVSRRSSPGQQKRTPNPQKSIRWTRIYWKQHRPASVRTMQAGISALPV